MRSLWNRMLNDEDKPVKLNKAKQFQMCRIHKNKLQIDSYLDFSADKILGKVTSGDLKEIGTKNALIWAYVILMIFYL